MAFRSLVLASLLLVGCAANPSTPGHAQVNADAIAAVNAALAKKELLLVNGVPVLR
jgi:hypothetical protein